MRKYETAAEVALKGSQGSNENKSPNIIEKRADMPIIVGPVQDWIVWSVAFLADEKQVVAGIDDGKIWYWRMDDGTKVGTPIDAGADVFAIAVSEDGKWIVAGMENGNVSVWDAKSRGKMIEFKAHCGWVNGVDFSPGAAKFATGSDGGTVRVWSLSTGEQLLSLHQPTVKAVKFAPNGSLLAAGSVQWYMSGSDTLRIYNSLDGHLVVEFKIRAESLAWLSDSMKLFALSSGGSIHCFDAPSRTTLSMWAVHSGNTPRCVSLACNGTFIAACADSSVSFWDTATHQQIGTVIHHPGNAYSLAISVDYNLVIGGKGNVSFWNLCDILSPPYVNDEFVSESIKSSAPSFISTQTTSSYGTENVQHPVQNDCRRICKFR